MNKKILLLAILFFIPIWKANAQTLELSDINMKLDLDDDFITFTRNNLSDNPNLSKFQLTEQSMKSKFIDNDIYVDAILNNKLEFILQVTETDLENINNLSYCDKNDLKKILNDYKDVTTLNQLQFMKININLFLLINLIIIIMDFLTIPLLMVIVISFGFNHMKKSHKMKRNTLMMLLTL